jgi:hypothetical protein
MLAPLAFVFFFTFRIERMTTAGARDLLRLCGGDGRVDGEHLPGLHRLSIAMAPSSPRRRCSLGLSLWGYTTKRDLTRFSTFLMVGLIAVIGVEPGQSVPRHRACSRRRSRPSACWSSPGLTAWDTQRLKSEYLAYAGTQNTEQARSDGRAVALSEPDQHVPAAAGLIGQREE